jgi:hypothetical protein
MATVATGLKVVAIAYFLLPDLGEAFFKQWTERHLQKFKLVCWATLFVLLILYR